MEDVVEGLDSSQKEAVTFPQGPLLIVAGAGTGKTTVITRRIAYLINTKKAKPEEILALTFTDKAAKEMEERVDALIPYGYTDIWISTFHAFGDRVLRENALEAGLSPDFQVLTRPEQAIFFREQIFEFPLKYYRPLGNPLKFIDALLNLISRAKDEDVSSEEYLKYAESLIEKAKENPEDKVLEEEAEREFEVANVYQVYQRLMAEHHYIDFGDQVLLTLKLLREHPLILEEYQKRFKYILVDEFQDTNYAQFQLVKLLAQKHRNIAVVGDDDQCLPPRSMIATTNGEKRIAEIKVGDKILTGVGKGHIGISKVVKVFSEKKKTKILTFFTKRGYKLEVTQNHKMFSFVPAVDRTGSFYYTYLMWRKNLGWRLGTTNDLATRLRLERSADKIIGIRGFKAEREATYFETLLSLKYGIPTVCFQPRKGVSLTGRWLKKLYNEIDTEKAAARLASDLGIDISAHHYCLNGVTRGDSQRIKINLKLCHRSYTSKSGHNRILQKPSILHQVSLQTSNNLILYKLKKADIPLTKAKKGMRVRITSSDLKSVGTVALHLQKITQGILECSFAAGTQNIQHKKALLIPASNILIGHYLPVKRDSKIIYDQVIKISEREEKTKIYDLEIDKTHNFFANGVMVHNSIYKFRGAAISNILGFMDGYRDAHQIVLTRNYRSYQPLLDTAYRLIKYNNPDRLEEKNRIDKKLLAIKEEGGKVECLSYDTVFSESDAVAKIIKDKTEKGNYRYKDFAILVRRNKDADPFLRSLNMLSIPWKFSGAVGLYEQEEVRLLINFLRVISDHNEDSSLFYLASSEIYRLNPEVLVECNSLAKRKTKSLWWIFSHIDKYEDFKDVTVIKKIVADINSYTSLSLKRPTGEVLYKFLYDTGYLNSLVVKPSIKNEERIKNIAKFFDIVQRTSKILTHNRVKEFTEYLTLLIQAGDDPTAAEVEAEEDTVAILTVHKAKGLEFSVVFMVSLVQDRFPTRFRREGIALPDPLIKDILPSGDYHYQEERRLFYVGMTRTKEELFLTSAEDYGGKRRKKISPFVAEALDLSPSQISPYKPSSLEVIKRNAPTIITEPKTPYTIPSSQPLYLSYWQIDDYHTCPLKYKYVHILHLPVMRHHAIVYGAALHIAIQKYFREKLKGYEVPLKDFLKFFEQVWVSEGFLSPEHERIRFEKGKEVLKIFYEREKTERLPTYIEKTFNFQLENDRIRGRWDRIDEYDGEVRIIDYKSSEVKTKEKADKETRINIQLSIYSLAYREIYERLPDKVELYFLESGIKGEAERGEKDMERTIKLIEEVSKGIRAQDYTPKPNDYKCSHCAYGHICDKGR